MSFKKNLTLILALIFATGFPMTMAKAADGEYVFITAGHDNPYWTTLGEGIKDGAKAKGVTAIVYEAKDNRDVEGELNLCLTALLRKPKIVVMGSLNASIAIQCFKKAAQEGIMVADIDATLSVAEAEKEGWLGEVEGLQTSLAAANDKLRQLSDAAVRQSTLAGLGITDFSHIASREVSTPT